MKNSSTDDVITNSLRDEKFIVDYVDYESSNDDGIIHRLQISGR
jgi:hypothetical protein